ncbi:MAG TPA: ATP-binding protein [Candidatus Saccharimonadales bacterium]|nr:ATP-binding protein [Candidatus Saccharimonadales bacterium]
MSTSRKTQVFLAIGLVTTALLLAAVFTLGSLTLPFQPTDQVVLYALSMFVVTALVVFLFILARTLLRLGAERLAHKPGSRFKTRMVLGAIAVSFLPVIVLFFVSYALLNRTLVLWFPRPLEIATESSRALVNEMSRADADRMAGIAKEVAGTASADSARDTMHAFDQTFARGADLAWEVNESGRPFAVAVNPNLQIQTHGAGSEANAHPDPPALVRQIPGGAELWEYNGKVFLAGRAKSANGFLLAGRIVPDDFQDRIKEIATQTAAYEKQRQHLRTYKNQMLATLLLFTILLIFAATWAAFFLSKQVTVPIQALAQATQAIIEGNYETRVNVKANDELETLVNSFNRMTEQLGDSRRQIDIFTQNLQQAVQELERRRTLMETILENIPTGVISVDETESIRRVNPAAVRMFGESSRQAQNFAQLLGEEAAHFVHILMRRSLRLGTATQELEFSASGRLLRAAVTVSSLGPLRSNRGYVVVVDDLTDLLRAQKAAAWQEVAQRIAHEIKNPLTPIQLSSQRLSRYLERHREGVTKNDSPELVKLVGECSGLIEREVRVLESLVGEFSQFARFPTAKLSPVSPNEIVIEALSVFEGRLEGIHIRKDLAPDLPVIRADSELLRRVLVNLIDNAAESMEDSAVKDMLLRTRFNNEREIVEIIVSDSGHGISPEDKDRLFLPHFSTKDRGTGLGLAIASRIMAEHHGSIRAEDNLPTGAKFILQLPMAEVASAPMSPRIG